MMQIIKSNERHFEDAGWLQTYWHFSFSDYYDPKNMNFGALRVFNDDVVHPGEVQVMSAGKGIMHSEYNHSKEKPVHLMQIWIMPRHQGSKPRWEQKQFTPDQRAGKLLPVVSSGDVPGTLAIDQDVSIYVS